MKQETDRLGVKLAGGLKEVTTAWSGASLLIDLYRKLELEQLGNRVLPAKKSAKGLTPGQTAETFVLLSALGGECIEDMERLREDEGLTAMLGYRPPAPETARQWLDRFHDETLLENRPLQGSFIPPESTALSGLRELNRRIIWSYVENLDPGPEVTLDVDTQLIETYKEQAHHCYEHFKAFQAMKVVWAETMLLLNDEFRDGNVSAGKDIKRMVDEAVATLPQRLWQIKIRSDAAAYEMKTLDYWDSKHWGFAVSAEMHTALKKEIGNLPEDAWRFWNTDKTGFVKEWAELPFVPSRLNEKKDTQPYRYIVIRMRQPQGKFFLDGTEVHHYTIVSNIWDMEGQDLIEWQRGKAGTIEQVHHVLVSDLASGVFPSAKYGANAGWLRLQVITYNLLEYLKEVALPAEYQRSHPKRLRFAIFTVVGRLVSHAGQTILRIANAVLQSVIKPGRLRIEALS